MATCKNFNTINSKDIIESYVFIHTSSDYHYTYNCTIDILPGQEHCNLTLVDTFSYEFIYYFNITLEEVCICIQHHNLSPVIIRFRYS